MGDGTSYSSDSRGDGSFPELEKESRFPSMSGTANSFNASFNRFNVHAAILQIPYSGLTTLSLYPSLTERLGLDASTRGDVIIDVIPGSPAEKVSIRTLNLSRSGSVEELIASRGDIILEVDGSTSFTTDYRTIEEYILDNKRVGENITLSILRDGQLSDIEMTLASKPTFLSYENAHEGVEIKYPFDWILVEDEDPAKELIVQFHSDEKIPTTKLPAVNVSVSKYPSNYSDSSKISDANVGKNIKIFRILDFDVMRFHNSSAYFSIYYEYSQNNNVRKILTVITEWDSKIYNLNFSIYPNKYDDYLPILREMIESFQLN